MSNCGITQSTYRHSEFTEQDWARFDEEYEISRLAEARMGRLERSVTWTEIGALFGKLVFVYGVAVAFCAAWNWFWRGM